MKKRLEACYLSLWLVCWEYFDEASQITTKKKVIKYIIYSKHKREESKGKHKFRFVYHAYKAENFEVELCIVFFFFFFSSFGCG